MRVDNWPIEVTFWGLNIYEAIRDIALDEWKQDVSLFSHKPSKSSKPKYHDACMNVYIIPSEKTNMVWLQATDGRVSVAMEVMGNSTDPISIPKRAIPGKGNKADSSGWHIKSNGERCIATRISKGYTGQVQEGESVEFDTTPITDEWLLSLSELRRMPKPTAYISCSAKDIGKAFTALGVRYDHSFYWPICAGVSERNRDIVAYSDDVHRKAVARIATSAIGSIDEC